MALSISATNSAVQPLPTQATAAPTPAAAAPKAAAPTPAANVTISKAAGEDKDHDGDSR